MNGSIRLVTLFNIPVKIHWSFGLVFIWVGLLGWLNQFDIQRVIWLLFIFMSLFICVVMHEYGHALMARRYGVRTRDIVLSPIGGLARLEKIPENPYHEFNIALAGPLVNFVLAGLIFGGVFIFGDGWEYVQARLLSVETSPRNFLPTLATMNLALAVFNLIPAFPMDGGRILRALLAMKLDRSKATRYATIIGQGLAIVGSVIFVLVYFQPIAVLICLFIFFMASKEYQNMKAIERLEKASIHDVLRKDFSKIYIDESMERPIRLLKEEKEYSFLIVDRQDKIKGILHAMFVMEASKQKEIPMVVDYLSDNFEFILSHQNVKSVYDKMMSQGYSILPVMEEAQLIGVIDRKGFKRFIKMS